MTTKPPPKPLIYYITFSFPHMTGFSFKPKTAHLLASSCADKVLPQAKKATFNQIFTFKNCLQLKSKF